ncbi:MAG: prepilin peptidase [Lachnospiraceae bacterium]|nr:prepilin peptidase [Lachnospiraceae bacterium]MDY3223855.1 prepilin peptidase [Lachnospiraceae bacterium]
MVRLTLFFVLLSLAAVADIQKRIIPDWMPIVMVGASLIPPEPVYLTGLFVALPLLFAGITVGGIGGGDIKLTGACGLVLGFERTLVGLLMALSFLLLFHAVRQCVRKMRKVNCVAEKEQAYPLVPFLLLGMFLSVRIGG